MSKMDMPLSHLQPPVKKTEDVEKKEGTEEYNPILLLHERERYDGKTVFIDKERGPVWEDPENRFVLKNIRNILKDGSLLDLGSGIPHVHQMCALVDKLSHITALDISPVNNKLLEEFLKAPLRKGKLEMSEAQDVMILKMLAEALGRDREFELKVAGKDILPLIHERSLYKGRLDLITADMIADMNLIGSGEVTDNRKYDNALLSFATFAQDEEQLTIMLENIQKRLKEGGRLIIVDFETYEGPQSGGDLVYSEDKAVVEKYPSVFDWTPEQMTKILKEIGLMNVQLDTHEISATHAAEQQLHKYLFLKAEKASSQRIYRV